MLSQSKPYIHMRMPKTMPAERELTEARPGLPDCEQDVVHGVRLKVQARTKHLLIDSFNCDEAVQTCMDNLEKWISDIAFRFYDLVIAKNASTLSSPLPQTHALRNVPRL